MEEQYDLDLVQAEDYARRFAYRRPNDTYLDFRTVTDIDAQIRSKEHILSPLLLDLVAADYLTVDTSDPNGRYLNLLIPGEATATLESKLFKTAAWDLFVKLAGGERVRLLQGLVTIDPAATAVA
jgi:hypothetical protein